MNPLPLQLRPRPSAPPPPPEGARGVYLASAHPLEWMTEAAGWGKAGDSVRFFILPVSASDPRPGGALMLTEIPVKISKDSRAQLCHRENGRGPWIFHGSEIFPALTPAEMENLLPSGVQMLHPSLGLVAWDVRDACTPGDLLLRPPTRGCSWEMARPGPDEPPLLGRVIMQLPDNALEFLRDSVKDIGGKSLGDLRPPGWTELPGGKFLLGASGLFLSGASAALEFLGKMGGPGASGPAGSPGKPKIPQNSSSGYLNSLAKWLSQQSERLDALRAKEIERLLSLLENDPVEGLRYALPLHSEQSRGIADQPGSRLSLRNPSFGAGGGGAAPADNWNLDTQARWKLEQRYRQIADAENRAGRHDRAAYIYGELLGNWELAAAALAEGGRHREAAKIYLHRQKNKKRAAECLERAGLLAEAAELFAEVEMHERSGQLWLRLGKRDAAFQAWLKAINASASRIEGARIIENRLGQPGWAAAVLESGWPAQPDALPTLAAHFDLLVRCQAYEETQRQVERIKNNLDQFSSLPNLLGTLAEIYPKLPPQPARLALQHLARRMVAVIVGGQRDFSSETSKKALALLPRFSPDDDLLEKDIRRHAARKIAPARLPLRRKQPGVLQPVASMKLEAPGIWHDGISLGGVWCQAGQTPDRAIVLFSGDARGLFAPVSLGVRGHTSAWLLPDKSARVIEVATGVGVSWTDRSLGCGDRHPAITVRPFARLEPAPFVLSRPDSGLVHGLVPTQGGMLDFLTLQSRGLPVRTCALGWMATPDATPRLVVHGRDAVMTLENQIYWLKNHTVTSDPAFTSVNLPSPVSGLWADRPGRHLRVAVACGEEIVMLSPELKWEPVQVFNGAGPVVAAFLPSGNLCCCDSRHGLIQATEGRMEILAKFEFSGIRSESPPLRIFSLGPTIFAVLFGCGSVAVFDTAA